MSVLWCRILLLMLQVVVPRMLVADCLSKVIIPIHLMDLCTLPLQQIVWVKLAMHHQLETMVLSMGLVMGTRNIDATYFRFGLWIPREECVTMITRFVRCYWYSVVLKCAWLTIASFCCMKMLEWNYGTFIYGSVVVVMMSSPCLAFFSSMMGMNVSVSN